jgi:hypothetical protein
MKKEADEIQSYTITKNSLNKIKGKGTLILLLLGRKRRYFNQVGVKQRGWHKTLPFPIL